MLNHYAAKVIENVATTSTSHAQVSISRPGKIFQVQLNISRYRPTRFPLGLFFAQKVIARHGSFTLPETDSGTDSDSGLLHCTMQNMFTLHRFRLGSLLLISVQDRNLSLSPSPAM